MTRRLLHIVIVLLCLFSCKEQNSSFVLEGHVSRLSADSVRRTDSIYADTLYIYGADALYERFDTVVALNGVFHYTTSIDTITPLWILFPNMHREMVFADKSLTVTIQGDSAATSRLRINGGEQNALMSLFHLRTDSLTPQQIIHVADSFIRASPYSEVSIHLLRHYFVDQPHPDATKIKTLIGSMSGRLQDNNYIKQLQRTLGTYKPLAKNSVVPNYNVLDSEGTNVSTADYRDTYLLITFWASWDYESRQRQRELIAIKKKYAKHNLDILSVSLDTDRDAWLQAIAQDSLTWRQACDLKGWGTSLVQRLQIDHLPANLLLNPQRRIQAIDLYGESLDKRIGELTEKKKPEKKKAIKKTPANIKAIKKKN